MVKSYDFCFEHYRINHPVMGWMKALDTLDQHVTLRSADCDYCVRNRKKEKLYAEGRSEQKDRMAKETGLPRFITSTSH